MVNLPPLAATSPFVVEVPSTSSSADGSSGSTGPGRTPSSPPPSVFSLAPWAAFVHTGSMLCAGALAGALLVARGEIEVFSNVDTKSAAGHGAAAHTLLAGASIEAEGRLSSANPKHQQCYQRCNTRRDSTTRT